MAQDRVDKLLRAAGENRVNAIKSLLEQGLLPEVSDTRGWNALHVAAIRGATDVAKFMLRIGVEVNALTSDGTHAILLAARQGHLEILEALIEAGADVAAYGGDALMRSLYGRQYEAAALLIEAGADPSTHDEHQDALTLAIREQQLDIARLLVERDARLDGFAYDTPLSMAISHKTESAFVSLLLEAGADPEHASDDGETPMVTAAAHGNLEAAKLLREKGASLDATENRRGWTPLFEAVRAGHEAFVAYLIEEGVALDHEDADGLNAHTVARMYKRDAVAELLVASGCPVQMDHQSEVAAARVEVDQQVE